MGWAALAAVLLPWSLARLRADFLLTLLAVGCDVEVTYQEKLGVQRKALPMGLKFYLVKPVVPTSQAPA